MSGINMNISQFLESRFSNTQGTSKTFFFGASQNDSFPLALKPHL
jgi:hypothetical protein